MSMSDETRELLNKGIGLHRHKLGDIINDAILEAVRNSTADVADAEEDTNWGQALALALDEKVSKTEYTDNVNAILKKITEVASLQQMSQALSVLANNYATTKTVLRGLVDKIQANDTANLRAWLDQQLPSID